MIVVTMLAGIFIILCIFIFVGLWSSFLPILTDKQKRKRKPEYDPYSAIDIEQAMLDRVDRAKAELQEAERDLYEYYLNKINNHVQPRIFIPTEDDITRIERDNKLLAYIRRIKD
jgi:hypothetical protein